MSDVIGGAWVEIHPRFRTFDSELRTRMRASGKIADEEGVLQGRRYGSGLSRGLRLAPLAFAVVSAGALKLAGDFQQSTSVLKTAAGETTSGLKIMRQGILGLAVETGTTTHVLVDGSFQIEKAGYRGGAALAVLRASAQGAREEGASLQSVANALTSVMASYGLQTNDTAKAQHNSNMVMNEMRVAAGESKTTMELFAGSLSNVLPIAASAKISFAEVGGAIGTLTSHGTTAQRATYDLAFLIRGLQAPNNVARNTMEQLGISSRDLALNLGKRGLTGTLDYLVEKITKSMGPSGLVLFKSFNQSKLAAESARTMIRSLPPELRTLAQSYADGGITVKDWIRELKGLTPVQAAQLRQFAATENRSKGFNQMLRSGTGSSVTFSDALKKITGGATGLNTALQLTGASSAGFEERVKKIDEASKTTGKDIQGWDVIQKNFNFKLDQFRGIGERLAITYGTKLIPPMIAIADLFLKHQTTTTVLIGALALLTGATITASIATRTLALAKRTSVIADILQVTWTRLSTTTLATWIGVKAIELAAWVRSTAAKVADMAVLTAYAVRLAAVQIATKIWAATQWLLNVALSANPIGLVILALAAFAAGIIYAYHHSDAFRRIVQTAFRTALSVIQGVWNWIRSNWPLLLAVLVGPIGVFITLVIRHFGTLKSTVTGVARYVVSTFLGMISTMLGALGRMIGAFARLPGPLGAPFRAARDAIHAAKTKVDELKRSIDAVPRNHPVKIPVVAQWSDTQAAAKAKSLTHAGFQVGGTVPGSGSGDIVPAMLEPGEEVIRRPVARRNRSLLKFLNRFGDRVDVGGDVANMLVSVGHPLRLASGGTVGRAQAFVREADSHPYVWGGTGPGGWDCSGLTGSVYGILRGSTPYRRYFTTASGFSSLGFKPGTGLYTIGVTPGVHMAGNVGGLPFEAASTHSGIHVGSSARSVTTFSRVYHLGTGGPLGSELGPVPAHTATAILRGVGAGILRSIRTELGFGKTNVRVFDDGGYLPTGLSLAYNGTGRPEAVISGRGGGGASTTINVYVNAGVIAQREELRNELVGVLEDLKRRRRLP